MNYNRKHFLDLKSLEASEIHYILNAAQKMKYSLGSSKTCITPYLKGKTVATLFHEDSSRSKLSYELAAQNLSANVINLTTKKQFERGDSLKDVGTYVDQMGADFIVVRHPVAGGPHHLAKYVKASVINAGDGRNENPSQALIDLLTILEVKGSFNDLKVAIIGDVMHNRVAKSSIWGLLKLGVKVSIAGPPTLIPLGIEKTGAKVHHSATEALLGADVVLSVKVQRDRQGMPLIPSLNEYKKLYKLTESRLSVAKDDVVVMHGGSINRGIEISSEIIDGDIGILDKQQVNGIAIRMALFNLLGRKTGGARDVSK